MREASFASDALSAAAAYRGDADREINRGGADRAPGPGPFALEKRSVAASYQHLGDRLAAYRSTASDALEEVQSMLTRAASSANAGGDPRERQTQYLALIGQIEGRMLRLVQSSPLPLTGLSGMISLGDTGHITPLPITGQMDEKALRLIAQRAAPRLPAYEPVSVSEAVMLQPAAAAFGWVVAGAVDALPFLMMLFLSLIAWARRDEMMSA